ncbi:MAG: hypothetical protein ACRCYS_19660 [Beijerinckiaceae bacterium]
MATLTGARASSTLAVAKPSTGGVMSVYYGSYDFAANPSIADIVEFVRVPAGFVALGGHLRLEDIDTNGTPTFDMDIGDAADTDRLGNLGVASGTAVTGYLPEGGSLFPLNGLLKDGPVTYSAETLITGTVVAAAATFAAGTATVVIWGINP